MYKHIITALVTIFSATCALISIAKITKPIKLENIERTIRGLDGFGTRNTLSSQDDPKRGIGAARLAVF